MCAVHPKQIEQAIQQLIDSENNNAAGRLEDVEGIGDGDDHMYDASPAPSDTNLPAPVPQPHTRRVQIRNTRISPALEEHIPPTQQAAPAPTQRRHKALATPVAPLPAGIPLGGQTFVQNFDHRRQRQQVADTLTRLNREDTAAALQRRVKITMWCSAVRASIPSFSTVLICQQNTESLTEAVTNSRDSSNAITISNHRSILDHFTKPDGSLMVMAVYDWKDQEWIVSTPDVPHPLEGHSRILLRSGTLSNAQCPGIERFLAEDTQEATTVPATLPRKRKAADIEVKGKQQASTLYVKQESKPSAMIVPAYRTPSPLSPSLSPPPAPKKMRYLNPDSKSWIMRKSYRYVSHGLKKVTRLCNKGYDPKEALEISFPDDELHRSTWQRHRAVYYGVSEANRLKWEEHHPTRLWSEFWQEYSRSPEVDPKAVKLENPTTSAVASSSLGTKPATSTRAQKVPQPRPRTKQIGAPEIINLSDSSNDVPVVKGPRFVVLSDSDSA